MAYPLGQGSASCSYWIKSDQRPMNRDEPRMGFTFLSSYLKQAYILCVCVFFNLYLFMTETLYGLQSLSIYSLILYRKCLATPLLGHQVLFSLQNITFNCFLLSVPTVPLDLACPVFPWTNTVASSCLLQTIIRYLYKIQI